MKLYLGVIDIYRYNSCPKITKLIDSFYFGLKLLLTNHLVHTHMDAQAK